MDKNKIRDIKFIPNAREKKKEKILLSNICEKFN